MARLHRGATVQYLCLACVEGSPQLTESRQVEFTYELEPKGALQPPGQSRQVELLYELLPDLIISPGIVSVDFVRHEAGRIFDGVRRSRNLNELTPRQLEMLLAETLDREGYQTWLTPATRDGGRDVIGIKQGHLPILIVGEAKKMDLVEPTYIRSLFAVRDRDRAHIGLLATTGRFSEDARKEVRGAWKRWIVLRDGEEFLGWIDEVANR